MNDRIYELAIEAGFNPINCTGSNLPLFKNFANLIVQECYEICKSNLMEKGSEHDMIYNDGVMDCAIMIKNHFGITE